MHTPFPPWCIRPTDLTKGLQALKNNFDENSSTPLDFSSSLTTGLIAKEFRLRDSLLIRPIILEFILSFLSFSSRQSLVPRRKTMIYFQNPSPVPFRSQLDSEGEKKVIAVLTRVSRKCETTTVEYIYIYIPVFSFVSWVSSTPEYSKNNVATSR